MIAAYLATPLDGIVWGGSIGMLVGFVAGVAFAVRVIRRVLPDEETT